MLDMYNYMKNDNERLFAGLCEVVEQTKLVGEKREGFLGSLAGLPGCQNFLGSSLGSPYIKFNLDYAQ